MLPITRLWFDGDHGVARHERVTVDLIEMPRIAGLPEHLRAIDFAPAMRVSLVRESGQAWREMTAGERSAALAYLMGLWDAVRGAKAQDALRYQWMRAAWLEGVEDDTDPVAQQAIGYAQDEDEMDEAIDAAIAAGNWPVRPGIQAPGAAQPNTNKD